MNPLAVVVHLTRWDVVLANWVMLWVSPQIRYLIATVIFIFPALLAKSPEKYLQTVMGCLFVGIPFTLACLAVMNLLNSNLSRGVLGAHHYEMLEDGLLERTQYNETVHGWRSLDRVTTFAGYLMIRVSGASWHTLPLRDFTSRDHLHSFKNALLVRIQQK